MKKEIENLQAFLNAKHRKEELNSEKVELSIESDLRNVLDKLDDLRKKASNSVDEAYIPLRTIERAVRDMESLSTLMANFKAFSGQVAAAEVAIDKAEQKIKSIESELGVKVEKPKALTDSFSEIRKYQREEEELRNDLSAYGKVHKVLRTAIQQIP